LQTQSTAVPTNIRYHGYSTFSTFCKRTKAKAVTWKRCEIFISHNRRSPVFLHEIRWLFNLHTCHDRKN